MAFQLKSGESAREGVRRAVRGELETAMARAKDGAKHADATVEKDAVHDVRKCLKRVRAALRLVRDDLGDEAYHAENFRLRDAARPLAVVRDAQMLPETWALVCRELHEEVEPGTVATVREGLLANERDVAARVLRGDRAFAGVGTVVAEVLARVSAWQLEQEALAGFEGGLRRVYRQGHRARAVSAESRTVEDLHEWRKQAKYLWHALELLKPAWTARDTDLADRFHKLSTLLGDDHDLAVLRRTLAADPLPFGGHRVLKGVFALVDRRRAGLEQAAFALGDPLYADAAGVWTRRVLGLGPRPKANAHP